jgi:hypothetical protein
MGFHLHGSPTNEYISRRRIDIISFGRQFKWHTSIYLIHPTQKEKLPHRNHQMEPKGGLQMASDKPARRAAVRCARALIQLKYFEDGTRSRELVASSQFWTLVDLSEESACVQGYYDNCPPKG